MVLLMLGSFPSIFRINEFSSILDVFTTSQRLWTRRNVAAKAHYANQKEKSEQVIDQTNWNYVFQQPVQWFYSCRDHFLVLLDSTNLVLS